MRRFMTRSTVLLAVGGGLFWTASDPSTTNANVSQFSLLRPSHAEFADDEGEPVRAVGRSDGAASVQLAGSPSAFRVYHYPRNHSYKVSRPYSGVSSSGLSYGYRQYPDWPRYYGYRALRPYYFSYGYPAYYSFYNYPAYYPSYTYAPGWQTCCYRPSYSYYQRGFDYGGYGCPPATCCAASHAAPPTVGPSAVIPPAQLVPQPEVVRDLSVSTESPKPFDE